LLIYAITGVCCLSHENNNGVF